MRVLVLLNGAAGTLAASSVADQETTIADRFAWHGMECVVRRVNGNELAAVTRSAIREQSADLIIAGGGDGTLNTVASAMIGGGIAFGVLPLGTFNHFARELKIPIDLQAAIDALVAGTTVPISIGKVNERHFLLSCSIGLYTDMVRHRDAQREARGRRKLWAGAIAFCKMLVRWPLMKVRMSRIEGPVHPDFSRLTTTVHVSISCYQMQQLGLCEVPGDARDALNVLVSRHMNRRSLLGFMLKTIVRRPGAEHDVEQIRAQRLTLEVRRRNAVRVGYDGEVETMSTPLKIERIQDALQMRVPAAYLTENSAGPAAATVS